MELDLKAILLKSQIAQLINQSDVPLIAAENALLQTLLEVQTARLQQVAVKEAEREATEETSE